MRDRRSTPDPQDITCDEPASIHQPLVALTHGPHGPRDRQLLYGDPVTILGRMETHCLVRSEKDGYCGTVRSDAIGPKQDTSHKVTVRNTHAYEQPDVKSRDLAALSFGAQLCAVSETATFIETELGFVPRQHVHGADAMAQDPVAVAALFLGTPYLWGGNSFMGIDCSGLVQAACLACGVPCPGDSDQQAAHLGSDLPESVALRRNDLVFWKGHVALVTDEDTFIHANAGHMAVAYEPIKDAIARIDGQGDGRPTAYKRLPFLDR